MKREAKLLLAKACDSLILSIELFNRPHDRGRAVGVLIFLDHGFEMLLKSSILHRNGKIRDGDAAETIGFAACVRRSHSDGSIKYLTEEQVLVLQAINGQRDAAQHYLLNISESQLYLHVQSGVTLFRDILLKVFKQDLRHHLPNRVLPISTEPPVDLVTLFDSEVEEVKKLLQPGRRRHTEALARLRPLAILDAAIHGDSGQPSDRDLRKIGKAVAEGRDWEAIFGGGGCIHHGCFGGEWPHPVGAHIEEGRSSTSTGPRRHPWSDGRCSQAGERTRLLQSRSEEPCRQDRYHRSQASRSGGPHWIAKGSKLLQGNSS